MAPSGIERERMMLVAALRKEKTRFEERYRMSSAKFLESYQKEDWDTCEDFGIWLNTLVALAVFDVQKGKEK